MNKTNLQVIDPGVEIRNITNQIKDYFVKNGPDCKAIIGISGGKDSTVAAALCVRALGKERVLGVKMPQGNQHDIDIANKVIKYLDIDSLEVNIADACDAIYSAIGWDSCVLNKQVTSNTPARVRMTVLYALAPICHGRVINTCNMSEDYVGYSTKYGDAAGDFAILKDYTVTEILKIGKALMLPDEFIYKIPEDGLSGYTDEVNLGFSYETLDKYIRDGVYPNYGTLKIIEQKHKNSRHKERPMPRVRSSSLYPAYKDHDEEWMF